MFERYKWETPLLWWPLPCSPCWCVCASKLLCSCFFINRYFIRNQQLTHIFCYLYTFQLYNILCILNMDHCNLENFQSLLFLHDFYKRVFYLTFSSINKSNVIFSHFTSCWMPYNSVSIHNDITPFIIAHLKFSVVDVASSVRFDKRSGQFKHIRGLGLVWRSRYSTDL